MAELCTQRDLNCLSDPDRSTRKRALEKILKDVQARSGKPDFTADVVKTNLDLLHKPLLKCVKDPAEKCRELSVTLLGALIPLATAKDIETIAGETLVGIRERIGVMPQTEESEEVRLELLRLTKAVLMALPSAACDHIDHVVSILEKSSYDKFPDVKKLASELIVWLCSQSEMQTLPLKEYCAPLNKALLLNLAHQQQKIRVAALHAIGALVPVDPAILKDTLPSVAKLNLDRTHQLREQVLVVMAAWLNKLDRSEAPNILPILLHGAADELQQVQEQSVTLMEEVGMARSGSGGDQGEDNTPALGYAPLALYPRAFKARPCRGARQLVSECLDCVVRQLISELHDWSAGTRVKAAATMFNVLVYAEDKIGELAEPVLAAFSKACMDDEQEVCQCVEKCIRLTGAFVSAEVFVSITDSNVKAGNATAISNKSWLAVLATLLEGSTREFVAPLLPTVCDIVADMELSLPEVEEFQVQLLRVVLACITTGGDGCETVRRRLLMFLLRLQAMKLTCPSAADKAAVGVLQLAEACKLGGGEAELLALECLPVLQQICSSAADWRRDSHHLYIFDTLIRRAREALSPHLSLCVPVFALAADHQRDADVRSSLLLLLDDLVRQEELHPALAKHAQGLLDETILPVCVWRAGKVAAALRKAGVSCMHKLLQASLIPADALMAGLGKGFEPGPLDPVIKSCLDDDDADVRFMTCGALRCLLVSVEGRLDDEQVRNMYIELLKRMDDSNDRIRIECAAAFEKFMASVPRNYDAAQFDYIVRGLVVHLDDQNQQVQEGVLPAVLAAASVNPAQFLNIVKECRSKHRVTTYCDEAIARASQLAKFAAGDL